MSFRAYPQYKESGVEWLGQVPEHWETYPLFAVMNERQEKNTGNAVQDVLSLSYGRIISRDVESNFGLLPESFETYQIVLPGNIVLRLTDLQNDKRSLRVGLSKQKGIITSAYTCIEPTLRIDANFAYLLLHAYDLSKVFYGLGGGVRQTLNFADLKRLNLLLPPLPEQRAIAAFLDRETARLDTLIAKQERLIELSMEKRRALISHAVTRGLDASATLKDSGVEWLGQVPQHWDVKRLKYLTQQMAAGPFGSSLTKEMYTSFGYRVYGQEQVIPANFTIGDYYISEAKFSQMQQYAVKPKDILISLVGTFGKAAVVPNDVEPGIINPRLIKITPDLTLVDALYLNTLLQSQIAFEQMERLSRGGTMGVLNLSTISELILPRPPLDEQRAIVKYLDTETAKIDTLISKARRSIELMKEHRASLIAAAVTGKIDVRNHPSATAAP